jgi:hypothetical protein
VKLPPAFLVLLLAAAIVGYLVVRAPVIEPVVHAQTVAIGTVSSAQTGAVARTPSPSVPVTKVAPSTPSAIVPPPEHKAPSLAPSGAGSSEILLPRPSVPPGFANMPMVQASLEIRRFFLFAGIGPTVQRIDPQQLLKLQTRLELSDAEFGMLIEKGRQVAADFNKQLEAELANQCLAPNLTSMESLSASLTNTDRKITALMEDVSAAISRDFDSAVMLKVDRALTTEAPYQIPVTDYQLLFVQQNMSLDQAIRYFCPRQPTQD